MWEKIKDKLPRDAAEHWRDFAASLYYQAGDVTRADSFPPLADRLRKLEREHDLPGNRLFYLAVDPDYFVQRWRTSRRPTSCAGCRPRRGRASSSKNRSARTSRAPRPSTKTSCGT